MTPETTAYLKPIMEAAALLKLRPYPTTVETVGAVLDRLSRGFPGDVMSPLEALRAITSSSVGTVEELDILDKVWPDYSGDGRGRETGGRVMRAIHAAIRPYVLTFHATGQSYPLTAEDAQRLLDEYPAFRVRPNRVILHGHNSSRPADRTSIRPATLGGGRAFTVEARS